MTHGGTQVYVRTSQRDPPSPLPPQSSWEEKKNFFVSEESTAAILTRLRIGISGGALILKTDRSYPDRTQTAFSRRKSKDKLFGRGLMQTCDGYMAFYRVESPLYI